MYHNNKIAGITQILAVASSNYLSCPALFLRPAFYFFVVVD